MLNSISFISDSYYARPIGLTEPRKAGLKRQPNKLRIDAAEREKHRGKGQCAATSVQRLPGGHILMLGYLCKQFYMNFHGNILIPPKQLPFLSL